MDKLCSTSPTASCIADILAYGEGTSHIASMQLIQIEQIDAAVPDAELSFFRSSAGTEADLLIRR